MQTSSDHAHIWLKYIDAQHVANTQQVIWTYLTCINVAVTNLSTRGGDRLSFLNQMLFR